MWTAAFDRNIAAANGSEPALFFPSGPAGPIPYLAVPLPSRVVNTPEPGTAIQLLFSVLAILFLLKLMRRRSPGIEPKSYR